MTNRLARAFGGCFAMVAACVAAVASQAQASNAVRISQVYGGGGNSGASYTNDFVELFNASSSPVNIGGWVLTYASAIGSFGGSTQLIPAGTVIQPYRYYLIQLASGGAVGSALPTADLTGSINLSGTAGNIALITSAQTGSSNACSTLAAILVDKIGFGSTANCAETTASAAPSNTTAVFRKGSGVVDTDNNSADCFAAAPSPRNSASAFSMTASTGGTPAGDGWTVATTGTAGSFTGNSAGNAAAAAAGTTGNPAWGIWSNAGGSATATREMSAVMGQTLTLDLDNGFITNGSSVGVDFRTSSASALTVKFTGGGSFYTVTDASGTVDTTVGFTGSGIRMAVQVGQSGAYKLTIGSYTRTGTLASSATSITAVRPFSNAAGSGANYDAYFNNLSVSSVALIDFDGDGYNAGSTAVLDCNDNDAAIKPGAAELCSTTSVDNNCDGSTSDVDANASDKVLFYRDQDGDTYTLSTGANFCSGTTNSGYSAAQSSPVDCNDTSATIYPSAAELCSTATVDNNCDGTTTDVDANASDKVLFYRDQDGDTYTLSTGANFCSGTTNSGYGSAQSSPLDCNDTDAAINPIATEVCDSVDNDCDSSIDEGVTTTYYRDADGDTYGTSATTQAACSAPTGYVSNSTDCNDSSATVNPGATETCNGIDDDCAGGIDNGLTFTNYYTDADGDAYGAISASPESACAAVSGKVTNNTDCNDGNSAIKPSATDVCDGVDNNCDGTLDPSSCASINPVGNGKTGFGGVIGGSTLNVAIDGSDWVFTLTKGGAAFNDALVLYFDTTTGGFTTTSSFTDTNDYLRKAVSGYNGSARATVNFPSSFAADYAIALSPSSNAQFGGLWTLANNGLHTFIASVNLSPDTSTTSASYTFRIARSLLGIGSGGTFKMVGTYLNATTSYRSNEGYGDGLPSSNVDLSAATFTSYISLVVPCTDVDNDGYCADVDCDDNNAAKNPGATEICDGLDNDCDSSIDEGLATYTYYRDQDVDTYGNASVSTTTCATSAPSGYVTGSTDCDDSSATVYPGAAELCSTPTVDNDCDLDATEVDANAADKVLFYRDQDGDAYTLSTGANFCPGTTNSGYRAAVTSPVDCNDTNAAAYPGAAELCATSTVDNNCDGSSVDIDANAADKILFYHDQDGDAYTLSSGANFCPGTTNAGYRGSASVTVDCDDTASAVYPGAAELCATSTVDNNCDGSATDVDANAADKVLFYSDADNDTYTLATGANFCTGTTNAGYRTTVSSPVDCDDSNAAAYPTAPELCATNTVDNDCDGMTTDIDFNASDKVAYYRDQDGDGISSSTTANYCSGTTNSGYLATLSSPTDCNDANALIGLPATYYADADGDGYGSASSTTNVCTSVGTQWNFNSVPADASSSTGSTVATIGSGSVALVGGTSTTFVSGSGSTDPASADNTAYNTSTYPAAAVGSGTAGVRFNVSTVGLTGIIINWDEQHSATGSRYTRFEYTINGSTFITTGLADGGVIETTAGATWFNARTMDLRGISGVDNNANFGFRFVSIFAPGTSAYAASTSGSTYAPGGTIRFDMVTLNGTSAPSGYVTNSTDCNDGSSSVKPTATEICDGVDNNCDGSIDEGVKSTFYADTDGDGYGNASSTTLACSAPSGYVSNSTDCNDGAAGVNPGAIETCNGIDDDCAGGIDNGVTFTNYYTDADGDGYGASSASAESSCSAIAGKVTNNTDCNDGNAAINTGATEICDGVDNDCDSAIDEGVTLTFYRDADGDTYGSATVTTTGCSAPTGYVSNSTDCNDGAAAINPAATEVCDSSNVDENCNGVADNGDSGAADAGKANFYADSDGDTYGVNAVTRFCDLPATGYVASAGGDCNDASTAIHPGAAENCANIAVDNDCDGDFSAAEASDSTSYYVDGDGDGYGAGSATSGCAPIVGSVTNNTDCNDGAAGVNPGAIETCNGIDDNCAGGIDEGVKSTFYADTDGDGFGNAASTTQACSAPVGYVSNSTDCDDGAAGVNPGATETCNGIDDNCVGGIDEGVKSTFYADTDGDGFGNAASTTQACSAPVGYVSNSTDCDDTRGAVHALATFYTDADGDGYGTTVSSQLCEVAAPSGFSVNSTDCNDGAAGVNPGAIETCNGIDDNCAGGIDNGLTFTDYYTDADGDSYGATLASPQNSCSAIAGKVTNNTDCNDGSSAINPGAIETCNGIDDNCVGGIDEGLTFTNYYVDGDGDGYGAGSATSACAPIVGSVTNSTDCDDTRGAVHALATFYTDADGDGYGTTVSSQLCEVTAPSGFSANSTDCNDGAAGVNPGAIETCNGIDDNCAGGIDEGVKSTFYADTDGDGYGNASSTTLACSAPSGYVSNSTDCNDANAAVRPGATEICNGIDDDCAGGIDNGLTFTNYYTDADSDGYGASSASAESSCSAIAGKVTNNTDCNDGNAAINTGATEICDGVDNDCDSAIDEGVTLTFYRDADGDTYGSATVTTTGCSAPTGYVSNSTDCNDNAASVHPGATESCNGIDDDCVGGIDNGLTFTNYYVDGDVDGYGAGSATSACAPIVGSVSNNTDCDDTRGAVHALATFYTDADGDGYGTTVSSQLCEVAAPSGFSANSTDCNDGSSAINPGATETCNGIDDNCVGGIDEGVKSTFYADTDGDSFGNAASTTQACSAPTGYVSNSTDCDDNAASVHPGATETCNGIDDNCAGGIDDGLTFTNYYVDADHDNYGAGSATSACAPIVGSVTNNTDCNDGNAGVNPVATETCNGIDDNCVGGIDEGVKSTFYADTDGDGFGNAASTTQACSAPAGYVSNSTDCNDGAASVHPGATESCNGIDDDCVGGIDNDVTFINYYVDVDGDGYGAGSATSACAPIVGSVTNNTDCNDGAAGVNPVATETCNGIDDNCVGGIDEGVKSTFYADTDGDGFGNAASTTQACAAPTGYVSNSTDCNDNAASVHPGATETCNNIDDDCAGGIDNGLTFTNYYTDADGDSYGATSASPQNSCSAIAGKVTNNTDCNDGSSAINPGAIEVCDSSNVDENCNGVADNGDSGAADAGKTSFYADSDGDTYGVNAATRFCDLPATGYVASAGGDCNDSSTAIHPGAAENCANIAVDNDCDGDLSAAEASDSTSYYVDVDGDGYGAGSATSGCAPIVGSVTNNTDCNDGAAGVHPGAIETCNNIDDDCVGGIDNGLTFINYYTDADGDSYGATSASPQNSCSAIAGKVTNNTDCDDSSAAINPSATETCNGIDDNCAGGIDEGVKSTFYADTDGDGFGNAASTTQACSAPTGYVSNSTDCNDSSAAINPSATETCNGIDDNCAGGIDEGVKSTFYADTDGDGFGNAASTTQACSAPTGYVSNSTDCNDNAASVHPGAIETCNGVDDDCAGGIDNGLTFTNYYVDADGDGYGAGSATSACAPIVGSVTNNTDCNDGAAGVYPGATETCNGIDDNCVDGIDEGVKSTFYADTDGDGFGNSASTTQACAAPTGYVSNSTDCNDNAAGVYPGATETCNGIDDDCAGGIDNGLTFSNYYTDADSDNYGAILASPQNSCSAIAGKVTNHTDCNDANALINPGATEVCNGIDDNCVGGADDGLVFSNYYTDADGDGYGAISASPQNSCSAIAGKVTNNTDCNDGRATANPGAAELCNGLDDNCNGSIDDSVATFRFYRDDDGDGFGDPFVYLANCTGTVPDGFVSDHTDCDDTALLHADVDGDGVGSGPFTACGVASDNDNCPTTANANQANCDSDAQGNACDADDDNDTVFDANDAFACNAAKSIADATLSASQLATFLAGASGVTVDATSMSSPQLAAVADNASHIAANGIFGSFTIASTLSPTQITAILDHVQIGSSFVGGALVTIDATGMTPTQLGAVAADIAAVTTVENIILTAASSSSDISALVSKAPAGEVIIDATSMNSAQMGASVSGSTAVEITGTVVVDSGLSPAQIAEITGSLAPTGVDLQFDTTGMSVAQQGAVAAAIVTITVQNGGVNPYCDTTDVDADGFFADACIESAVDCGDSSASIYPNAVENCANDGVDNDCDGDATSDAEAIDSLNYYVDSDGDGFGAGSIVKSCTANAGYSVNSTDCNNSSASVYPGAPELCSNLAVDNNCNGSTAESEASDRNTYYADTDSDGAGDPASPTLACTLPAGYSVNSTDGCPSNGALTASITYYADTDGDGAGNAGSPAAFCSLTAPPGYASGATDGCPSDVAKTSPGTCGCGVADADSDGDGTLNCLDGCPNDFAKTSPGACGCGNVDTDSDSDGVANCNDVCPNDPLKTTSAGVCGCGTVDTDYNSNGVADCLEVSPVFTVAANAAAYAAGDSIVLRVRSTTPPSVMSGARIAANFDPTRLMLFSATPVVGGPFAAEISEAIDNVNGTLTYAIGVGSGQLGMSAASDLLNLTFVVLSASTQCATNTYVNFNSVGGFATELVSSAGAQPVIMGSIPTLRLDSIAPVLSGVIANATVPTDAGSIYGGYVAAPSVTAIDDCGGSTAVTISITLPDASVVTVWPSNGLFPIGTSTVTWRSIDSLGNQSSASRTITVDNYQLLDAVFGFNGTSLGSSSRQVRIKLGATTLLRTLSMNGLTASLTGLQVPVAAAYACMTAKDPVHSVTDAAAPTIASRKYSATFAMKQGDSNDDDVIDVLDFGIFIANRGAGKADDAVSNFDADGVVGNGDFSFVSLNFLRSGESCTPGVDAPQPLTRVSVKALRRAGLSQLVAADLNGDGWLDVADIAAFAQGDGATVAGPATVTPGGSTNW